MPRDAIVQMFDQPFQKVRAALPRLQKMGFSHILISPPQKSNPSKSWWGRYQPVDFRVIEGPLGNRADLELLCQEARRRDMFVVADAVLNHMSNDSRYMRVRGGRVVEAHFPRFGVNDFYDRSRGWVGKGRGLPSLKTVSPWVRQELREYLRMLYGLGIRGFRFDAAKHVEPEFFAHVLHGLPPMLCFGEMVYASADQFPADALHTMKAYDFPLAHTLKEAFAPGGDLGRLVSPADFNGALWGPNAVTFVNHHDLVKSPKDFAYFRVADRRDRQLAYVYILARPDGTPYVYSGDLRSKEVKAGVEFHNWALGQPANWVSVNRNLLVWTRGDDCLAAINKSGNPWFPGPVACGLKPGAYRDLLGGPHWVDEHGRWATAFVPPRGATLLIRR